MYVAALALHIVAGVATLGISIVATHSIATQATTRYPFIFKAIGSLAIFEVLSGTVVTILSKTNGSFSNFCVRIALYLFVVGTIEGILWLKMRGTNKLAVTE